MASKSWRGGSPERSRGHGAWIGCGLINLIAERGSLYRLHHIRLTLHRPIFFGCGIVVVSRGALYAVTETRPYIVVRYSWAGI